MLNYQIEGNGPPLLLIHGFGISFNIWQNLRPLLRDAFTLITIELPGIGKSSTPEGDYLEACDRDLESLRLTLKIERWNILGYSSGTRVAEYYLNRHADHVLKIIYLCPAQTQAFKAVGLRVAKGLDARFPSAGNWVLSGWRLYFLIRLLGFNLRPSHHARAWMNEISSQPVEILKETLHTIPDHGARVFDIPSVPYLFIWGRRDLITTSPRKPDLHQRFVDATHAAPVMNAEEVASVALPFLLG
jgi:pimeloyl-ACP methyl ester carboxylesterase